MLNGGSVRSGGGINQVLPARPDTGVPKNDVRLQRFI